MSTLLCRVKAGALPRHVAIIMDGNGRWASARGLPPAAGHQAGAHAAERLIRFVSSRLDIPFLTLFAFSSENWQRPRTEVDDLMDLLARFIEEKLPEFRDAGIRLRVIGDVRRLPGELQSLVRRAMEQTKGGMGLGLTVALGYGSRDEIAEAARRAAQDAVAGRLSCDAIDEAVLAARLATSELPDPDLILRTSGEMRLSNFLLWQSAYAELAFPETLWPDFTPAQLLAVIEDYQRRHRRFGRREGEAS
ncbi:MAG: polyprenyl diphosphate synthase [Candidatus Bipolaricaulota bacterium]